ncbi:hypothetical protein P153DRAFT_408568 [Dothidotthia symphoricarpi CBS 119687]|uniref:Uncharacterized protein n=1 Tax=Dothidotthia symphoricarpi CBS 119687 TaxID=1392245 RepID=A0A6A6A4N3_9PLEO|nr:uncharacterized protein P153DRAFT_408568 [Dothidotthia symphoricarpi CBS 119687]KAF2125718.1 hypothetical protein P153DRAFT_408568 [Dothidotthia symphoricarpi CBS 119687]
MDILSQVLLPSDAAQGQKLYQAYCVSEPLSRAQSRHETTPKSIQHEAFGGQSEHSSCMPDISTGITSLESRILPHRRTIPNHSQDLDYHEHSMSSPRESPHIAPDLGPASNLEQHNDIHMQLKTEKKSYSHNRLANCTPVSGNTITGSQYHTVQPVTPRGNNLVVSAQELMYDGTSIRPQMQQLKLDFILLSQQSVRNQPISQHTAYPRMNPHPLPLLPTDENSDGETEKVRAIDVDRLTCDKVEHTWQQQLSTTEYKEHGSTSTERLLPSVQSCHIIPSRYTSLSCESVRPKFVQRTEILDDAKSFSTPVSPPPHRHVQSPTASHRPTAIEQQIPCTSSRELFTHQHSTADSQNTTRAYGCTQPRDANLGYVFNQPPITSDRPPPPPPHLILYRSHDVEARSPVVDDYFDLPTPPLSMCSSSVRPGARLPPWGSLEDLQSQRKNRTEVRAHVQSAQNRALRDRMDAEKARSTLHGQCSTDDLRRDVVHKRQEVEHIKEEILGVYPDMAFDGGTWKLGKDTSVVGFDGARLVVIFKGTHDDDSALS